MVTLSSLEKGTNLREFVVCSFVAIRTESCISTSWLGPPGLAIIVNVG